MFRELSKETFSQKFTESPNLIKENDIVLQNNI